MAQAAKRVLVLAGEFKTPFSEHITAQSIQEWAVPLVQAQLLRKSSDCTGVDSFDLNVER